MSITVDAEDGRLFAKSGLHDAAPGLLTTFIVLVQHIDDGVVFLHVSGFTHGFHSIRLKNHKRGAGTYAHNLDHA